MYEQLEKPKENKNRSDVTSVGKKKCCEDRGSGLIDNRLLNQKIVQLTKWKPVTSDEWKTHDWINMSKDGNKNKPNLQLMQENVKQIYDDETSKWENEGLQLNGVQTNARIFINEDSMQSIIKSHGYQIDKKLDARFKNAYKCIKKGESGENTEQHSVFMFEKESESSSNLTEEFNKLSELKNNKVNIPDTNIHSTNEGKTVYLIQEFVKGNHFKAEDLPFVNEQVLVDMLKGNPVGEAQGNTVAKKNIPEDIIELKDKLQNLVDTLANFNPNNLTTWGDAQFILRSDGTPFFMDPLDVKGYEGATDLAKKNLANLNNLKTVANDLLLRWKREKKIYQSDMQHKEEAEDESSDDEHLDFGKVKGDKKNYEEYRKNMRSRGYTPTTEAGWVFKNRPNGLT